MDLGERYLELALRFGRLAPSMVESYVGPAEIAERVDGEPAPDREDVAQQAALLADAVRDGVADRSRRAWLIGQAGGIQAACEWLDGDAVGYRELAWRCHGIKVEQVAESQFEQAHELVMQALPGPGEARERFAAWRTGQLVAGDQLINGLRALVSDLRGRCHQRWPLPEGEHVTVEVVRGQPWAGNADYRGGLHTMVSINDERPLMAWWMVELIAHEAYPGHHSEAVCKDSELTRGDGRVELCVGVFPTPQALIAEGIAMLAPQMLLGDEIEDVGAACLRPLGIEYDTAGSAAVRQAHRLLTPVRANLALMLDEGQIDVEGMYRYARRWLLEDDAYVARLVQNVCESDWPAYESCYAEGLRLCGAFVAGDPKRFDRLLREQLTPAALQT